MKEYKVTRHFNNEGLQLSDIITKFLTSFLDKDLIFNKENDKIKMDITLYL